MRENDMDKQAGKGFQLNAGTGMVAGIITAALVALLVSSVTGDNSVWSWAIPVGLASGLAVGAGQQRQRAQRDR